MTKSQIKNPLVVDIAYNNCITKYNPTTGQNEYFPPDIDSFDFNLIKGCICKATEYVEDFTFGSNWVGLKRNNCARGAYHFIHMHNNGTAGQQAKKFVNTINKYGEIEPTDILVLDAEEDGMSIAFLIDFIYNVELLTGKLCKLYSREELLNNLSFANLTQSQKDYIKKVDIWVAGYLIPNADNFSTPQQAGYIPDTTRYGRTIMWQYDSEVSNVGNIPGGTDVNWISPEFYNEWIGGEIIIPSKTKTTSLSIMSNGEVK